MNIYFPSAPTKSKTDKLVITRYIKLGYSFQSIVQENSYINISLHQECITETFHPAKNKIGHLYPLVIFIISVIKESVTLLRTFRYTWPRNFSEIKSVVPGCKPYWIHVGYCYLNNGNYASLKHHSNKIYIQMQMLNNTGKRRFCHTNFISSIV